MSLRLQGGNNPGYTETMADQDKQLNEQQRIALVQFMEDRDRGKASIFVGRETELDHVRGCVNRLLRRQDEAAPGSDLTTVIQGAPGAGKSALLEKIAEDWPLGGQGQAVAVSLDPGLLTLSTPEFLDAVIARTERVPGVVQILQKYFKLKSVSVAGVRIEASVESSPSSGKPPVPVILLFDEIQTKLAGSIPDQSREQLADNLRLLHTGHHNAPLFPVYGGLANSADLLRAAGLTRLAMGSELTLPGFSDEEMNELMERFVDKHLSSARPSQTTIDQWGASLRRDSQGWPMHCRNFLIALCEQIRGQDWQPEAVDLDTVRIHAHRLRCAYYEQRMQGALRNRYRLISKVLEEMRQASSMQDDQIMYAIARAHQDPDLDELGRGSLPEGVTAEQAFDAMLHAGIVQKKGRASHVCPIPSLAGYVAAMATLPPRDLHNAVLDAQTELVDHCLNRRRNEEQRGKLLQATDIRGRTPLMLAVELGIRLMVEHLVQAESRLPPALRSVELRDNEGRTARDYAVASGDERIMALLNQLQPEGQSVPSLPP